MQQKRKANKEWVTIIDQPTLERAILLFCQEHFRQAAKTPFGSGQLFELLSASGLKAAGEQILQGICPDLLDRESSVELRAFISQLTIPEKLWEAPQITLEVTDTKYIKALGY